MTLSMLAGALPAARTSIWSDMWNFQIPATEKILRTIGVYVAILVIVRLAGKRLMAQMNSLDLVVVLLLSNVVQNAVIGDDNSLTGGILGAIVLVLVNAGMDRAAQHWPAFDRLTSGSPTPVVRDGEIVEDSLDRLGMTASELDSALRRQGADSIGEVAVATIDPGGSITVDLKEAEQALSRGEFEAAMTQLHRRLDALTCPPPR